MIISKTGWVHFVYMTTVREVARLTEDKWNANDVANAYEQANIWVISRIIIFGFPFLVFTNLLPISAVAITFVVYPCFILSQYFSIMVAVIIPPSILVMAFIAMKLIGMARRKSLMYLATNRIILNTHLAPMMFQNTGTTSIGSMTKSWFKDRFKSVSTKVEFK